MHWCPRALVLTDALAFVAWCNFCSSWFGIAPALVAECFFSFIFCRHDFWIENQGFRRLHHAVSSAADCRLFITMARSYRSLFGVELGPPRSYSLRNLKITQLQPSTKGLLFQPKLTIARITTLRFNNFNMKPSNRKVFCRL